MMYDEGQIIDQNVKIDTDAICSFELAHQDHVYCVANLPQNPYNTFLSGDGNDKCLIWTIRPKTL